MPIQSSILGLVWIICRLCFIATILWGPFSTWPSLSWGPLISPRVFNISIFDNPCLLCCRLWALFEAPLLPFDNCCGCYFSQVIPAVSQKIGFALKMLYSAYHQWLQYLLKSAHQTSQKHFHYWMLEVSWFFVAVIRIFSWQNVWLHFEQWIIKGNVWGSWGKNGGLD